jgi:hypothetical protein
MSTLFSHSIIFLKSHTNAKKKIKKEHSVTYSQIFEEKITNVECYWHLMLNPSWDACI